MKRFSLLLLLLLLTGCAVGNRYDYRSSRISLPLNATDQRSLALQVKDVRPYVVSGEKKASFVGLQRGGFGNPFDVTTGSGEPLADEMAAAIAGALVQAGYEVHQLQNQADGGFFVAGKKTGAKRFLLLTVKEWKSDVFTGITLHSDLDLKIYNDNGEQLANSTMTFVEGIGGAQIGAAKNSEAVTREFAKRIGYLFNSEAIRKALQ